jgi:LCP family protein required for cell wall assembly
MINPQPVQPRRSSAYGQNTSAKNIRPLPRHIPGYTGPAQQRTPMLRKLVIIAAVAFLLIGIPYLLVTHLLNRTKNSFANGEGVSLSTLNESNAIKLKGEDAGRTNFMIYGMTADESRTDTMLLASYYWKDHKLVTLNIPRDLFASYQGYNTKIVSLYAIAKQRKGAERTYPPQFVSDFVAKEYNIPIHYWVVANMNAMKQVVDTLGGIVVTNPNGFTDTQFPTDNYNGYIVPAPHFDAGVLNLNGKDALIYARSRHSLDNAAEGTDFARSKRQQIVLQAVLKKLKDQGSFTNLGQLSNYLQIFGQNIFTSMSPAETIRLARTMDKLNFSQDYLKSNWSNASGFLCDSSMGGEYVLLYGVPGNCHVRAGIDSLSTFRAEALTYVQNLKANSKP